MQGWIDNIATGGFSTGVKGIHANTTSVFAIHGVTTSQTSAGIVGNNSGDGEAVVGPTNSNIAGAVVGRNDGPDYGVHGFVAGLLLDKNKF